MEFKIKSRNKLTGDQPKAVNSLIKGIEDKKKYQVLLGITGSGKTFTAANVIQKLQRPTLILSHNKTLAAQLYGELKTLFPDNAVEYFVSYYDYYQPEAYLPDRDIYIEKEATINDQIDKMRLRATASLFERRDVIIVSSVSSIYTLGSPEEYRNKIFTIEKNAVIDMDNIVEKLVEMQYERNDIEFKRGRFRVLGDTVDIFPSHMDSPYRVRFYGDEIEEIEEFDHLNNSSIQTVEFLSLFPAKHFVSSDDRIKRAVVSIRAELDERVKELRDAGKMLEAERLNARTNYDLAMMKEVGYCGGIENYSRQIDGRKEGQRPFTLIDYFPDDFLTILDESHVTLPQIRGMYNGDRSRKMTLVEHGFRLKSALDNRPLKLDEFESITNNIICMSATPADYEMERAGSAVEMIIRPTGLIDPEVIIKPSDNQIDDLVREIEEVVSRNERVLVTTLTKKMAESLTDYLSKRNVNVRYMHSDIDALERVHIIRGLRLKEFDVLVGINLLREGLDLPEVSLVAILDADREGFLRSETSLIQTIGRAARNIRGRVVLYANKKTDSIIKAVGRTNERREKQIKYNEENNIEPTSIIRSTEDILMITEVANKKRMEEELEYETKGMSNIEKLDTIDQLTKKMHEFSAELEFEKAAQVRDLIRKVRKEIE